MPNTKIYLIVRKTDEFIVAVIFRIYNGHGYFLPAKTRNRIRVRINHLQSIVTKAAMKVVTIAVRRDRPAMAWR